MSKSQLKRLAAMQGKRKQFFQMGEAHCLVEECEKLYEIARDICHSHGWPWTDPRTGITYPPPK